MISLPPPPSDLLEGAALFLDFDGTLVELADTPGAIRVAAGLDSLLERLRRGLEGRLAIVSGRSVADLDRHVQSQEIAVSGSHGIELRYANGDFRPLSAPLGLEGIRSAVIGFARNVDGLLVEQKPAGVALHYRLAPAQAERVETFMTELAKQHGLAIQRGKMVVELRPHGADKGDAVAALMREPAFAGARPVFVGDDLTDEHGFQVAADLGGAGVLVGPGRATSARFLLTDVKAVFDWLDQAI